MRRKVIIIIALFGTAALGPHAHAENKFQKLTGPQIQAKLAGMN